MIAFDRPLSFRAGGNVLAMLDFLRRKWGASTSDVIRRCIELVYRGEEIENRVATFSARHRGDGKGKPK